MSTYAFTLAAAWVSACRLTATGATVATIINTSRREVNWWVTSDDTVPVVSPGSARQIVADGEATVTLANGDRLWMVGVDGWAGATVAADATMTVQDAFIGGPDGVAVAVADIGDVLRVYGALGGVDLPVQWRLGGVDIAGQTAVTHVVSAADAGGQLTAIGTGAHGLAVNISGSVSIPGVPAVTGAIADVSLTEGDAPANFSVAGAFTGGTGQFSITHPEFASIDSAGNVTIDATVGGFHSIPVTVKKEIGQNAALAVFNTTIALLRSSTAPVGNPLSYGRAVVSGTPLNPIAPNARKGGWFGDSRVDSTSSGSLLGEIVAACGEWVWIDPAGYKFAQFGSSIYHAVNTQAPAGVAANVGVAVVLTGTNGARKPGEGDGDAGFAARQVETINLLQALDASASVIFLLNELPGQNDGGTSTGSPLAKYQHHQWMNTLTKADAGISADLVIVNSWDAISDGAPAESASIAQPFTKDGLHPSNRGSERVAREVYLAMEAYFTQPVVDFSNPDQLLCDGTSTTNTPNRGVVPGGWREFGAAVAGPAPYSVEGTGHDTVLTITNGSGAKFDAGLQIPSADITDGLIVVEYEIDVNDSPSDTIDGAASEYAPKISVSNTSKGTVSLLTPDVATGTGQQQELGGRRRVTFEVGAVPAAVNNIKLSMSLRDGQQARIHKVDVHER